MKKLTIVVSVAKLKELKKMAKEDGTTVEDAARVCFDYGYNELILDSIDE